MDEETTIPRLPSRLFAIGGNLGNVKDFSTSAWIRFGYNPGHENFPESIVYKGKYRASWVGNLSSILGDQGG